MRGLAIAIALGSLAGPALADDAAPGASEPAAAPPRPPTPFDRGRISLNVSLGTQRTFDETYFAVGGRIGYYVLDGLEVGFGGVKWFGGDPSIAMISPELRYVLYPVDWSFRPFVGGFYHHWFIGDPYDDYDTVGGTLGVMYAQRGSALVLGLGATVEHVVSTCDDMTEDCTMIYPAVFLGFSL
jgi:hypothetical protein